MIILLYIFYLFDITFYYLNLMYNYLHPNVFQAICEGLANYEKKDNPTCLFGTVMILKAVCVNNNSYIDMIILSFMRVLHKLAKEHLQPAKDHIQPPTQDYTALTSELLILCLDLVKTRVVVMSVEMRKTFIGAILVGLIEKTPDIKVMKAITKVRLF